MTDKRKQKDRDTREAKDHREIIDEGPAPGADVLSELNMAQEQAEHEQTSPAQADDLARALTEQADRYLRLAAEFDNYRRRSTREMREAGTRAQAALAGSLLDTLDDLARVAEMRSDGGDVASYVEGVRLVTRKLDKALTAAGLETIVPREEKFDPAFHEAVATEPAASPDVDDMVATVFQPGYVFKGQLLRPARVVVRKWQG